MRLWSLRPDALDRAALVAGWREGLLAQKVLRGLTTGYRNHPQLERFRGGDEPLALISAWLHGVADEATARGYRFNRDLIVAPPARTPGLTVTTGQLALEAAHLQAKVRRRQPEWLSQVTAEYAHPLFRIVSGPVETWERAVPKETARSSRA